MKIKTKWVLTILILLLLTSIIYIYEPFSPGNKGPLSLSSLYYYNTGLIKLDPESVLQSLEEGNLNVFFPDFRLFDDRHIGPVLYNEPVDWRQSDNLKIVNAASEYISNDSLDGWKLFSMAFNVDCQHMDRGLPGGDFQYFRTIFENGKMIDTWREIEISSEFSWIAWGSGAKYPHPLSGRKSIDLKMLKVTADDAIRIAEDRGGKELRSISQNQCSVHMVLWPQGTKKGWWITYNTSSDFEVRIDPYTGEVIE